MLSTHSFSFGFISKRNIKVCAGGLVSPQQRKLSGHEGQGCCPYTSPAWQWEGTADSAAQPLCCLLHPISEREMASCSDTETLHHHCIISAATIPPSPLTSHPSLPQHVWGCRGHCPPHLAPRLQELRVGRTSCYSCDGDGQPWTGMLLNSPCMEGKSGKYC